jgi:hypothetical protein
VSGIEVTSSVVGSCKTSAEFGSTTSDDQGEFVEKQDTYLSFLKGLFKEVMLRFETSL